MDISEKQAALRDLLMEAMGHAIQSDRDLDKIHRRAQDNYRRVAEVLVDLREEFASPNGHAFDIHGRSAGYRSLVREVYARLGSTPGEPIPKRLTVGVAYWVRKIQIDRYGEQRLATEFGIVVGRTRASGADSPWPVEDLTGVQRLNLVIEMLNRLVVDPSVKPTPEQVRSALRAVALLRSRLASPVPLETTASMRSTAAQLSARLPDDVGPVARAASAP